MDRLTEQKTGTTSLTGATTDSDARIVRIKSEDLLQQQRELEIDHHGRIYRLRLTQLNKLILTA
ncbi:hemin uptake protein HemP [Noviherbaspirillum sp. Root189]|uniref:hemin uptake protein HemP n=1 Tax=Noviherbaspirillum sp. Root189 TaxID=1736487 RepID=UPI00070B4A16|nr:hemin uptake protein HemP [Noviherbaspirillum sp. Root189]KRB88517.1 hemin transporter [Noviherbaspirillum sp. Root189]